MVEMNRRKFLQTSAAVAATTVGLTGDAVEAAETIKSVKETVSGMKFTDQHGKNFNLAEMLEQPCVVVFGYGGCPLCEEITKVVAASQEKMLAAGIKDVPIIVISAQPESDRKDMAGYIKKYYGAGVRQFPEDRPPAGSDANLPQRDRILHVICPPTAKDTQKIEKAIAKEAGTDTGLGRSEKQHSRYLTPCMNGKAIPANGDPIEGAKFDRAQNNFVASDELIKAQSDHLLSAVQTMRAQYQAQHK